MKKLTEDEARKIPLIPSGNLSIARAILMNMEIGDIILLDQAEWKQPKKSPSELIGRMRRTIHRDYSCNKVMN